MHLYVLSVSVIAYARREHTETVRLAADSMPYDALTLLKSPTYGLLARLHLD